MNQTFLDRAHRLQQGQCPVHGMRMRPVSARRFCEEDVPVQGDHEGCAHWFRGVHGPRWRRVQCPRSDCGVTAREWDLALHGGPYELEASWEGLPDGWPAGGGPVALEDSGETHSSRREDDG